MVRLYKSKGHRKLSSICYLSSFSRRLSVLQSFFLTDDISSFAASQESDTCVNSTDEGSLLDAVASSDQVLSAINDAGDHVLKLSFIDSSPHKQSLFSLKRYTCTSPVVLINNNYCIH